MQALDLLLSAAYKAEEEEQSFSQQHVDTRGTVEAYMTLVNFCDRRLRESEEKEERKRASYGLINNIIRNYINSLLFCCSDQFKASVVTCTCSEDDAESTEAQLRGGQTQVPSIAAASGAVPCRNTRPDGQRGAGMLEIISVTDVVWPWHCFFYL